MAWTEAPAGNGRKRLPYVVVFLQHADSRPEIGPRALNRPAQFAQFRIDGAPRGALCLSCRHIATDAVFGQVAEIIILHLGKPVGFGNIDGNPALALGHEPGPAMIARYFPCTALVRNGKADLELAGDLLRPCQGNEQAVKVGAIAELAVASPHGIAVAPADAFLAVFHVAIDHGVKRFGRVQLRWSELFALDEFERLAIERNQLVGLQIAGQVFFVAGLAAYYLVKKRALGFAKRSLSIALGVAAILLPVQLFVGDSTAVNVTVPYQLSKLEAWEGNWTSTNSGYNVFEIPDQAAGKNLVQITIPWLGSAVGAKDLIANNPHFSRVARPVQGWRLFLPGHDGMAE